MKKIVSLLLAFTIMLSLCACQGNFGSVNLNDSIAIPDDGMIKENIIEQIQSENAIGVFTGESDGIRYEWTIFGSDIVAPKEINLAVNIIETIGGETKVTLGATEPFGFSALLSVYLNETWDAQSATGYAEEQAVVSVSLTGSKATILNMTLDGTVGSVVVRPDELPEEEAERKGWGYEYFFMIVLPGSYTFTEPKTDLKEIFDDFPRIIATWEKEAQKEKEHKEYMKGKKKMKKKQKIMNKKVLGKIYG